MKNSMEEHKKLLEEENRLLYHLKKRMLAGDDEKTLLEITARIDDLKEQSKRMINEALSLEEATEEKMEPEQEEILALREEFEKNRHSRIQRYKNRKILSDFLSLFVIVVGGAIGLVYAGPIGAMIFWGLGLIFYHALTSKFWVCPVCDTPFKRGGMSEFTAKLSAQAICKRCGFSVREIS